VDQRLAAAFRTRRGRSHLEAVAGAGPLRSRSGAPPLAP